MKLSNFDFTPRTGTHESFKDWRPDKCVQLSGNRIRLTAGSSWSAGITRPNLGLGTTTIEFDCRVMALDPFACFAIWRYSDKTQDEYDDVEFSQWGDANDLRAVKTTLWSKGEVYLANGLALTESTDYIKGFRRWSVSTTEGEATIGTTIQGWWRFYNEKTKQWEWDWKWVHSDGFTKPPDHTPGDFRIGLWVPKRGLLYPASASAPLVVTLNSMTFEPLDPTGGRQ